MLNLIVVYFGRFSPPHIGHKDVYDHLKEKFGKKSVYIATSNKVDKNSPFTFNERKHLLTQLMDIDQSKIIQTKKNYNVTEISETLGVDPKSCIFVVVLGEKDSDRLSKSKYFSPLQKKVQTMDKEGYYYVVKNSEIDSDVIHSKDIRKVMSKDNLNRKDYEYIYKRTYMEPNTVERLRTNIIKENVLTEGAVGGHIDHPYNDMELTFGEIFDLIDACLSGSLSKEELPTEKFDGQNMFATVKGKTVYFSRNKTNLKNAGKNAMTISDIMIKWKDKTIIDQAFTEGCKKMQSVLLSLSSDVLERVFKNGNNWINFEIVWSVSKNVIDYDRDFLVVHGITVVDEGGNKVSVDREARKEILSSIRAIGDQHVMIPNEIKVPKITDFSKKSGYYKRRIRTLMNKYKCHEYDTVGEWLTRHWIYQIEKLETKYGKRINNKNDIARRIALNDTSIKLNDIKTYVNDVVMYDTIRDYVKNNTQYNNEVMDKMSTIWLQVGMDVLSNIDTFLMAGNNTSLKRMRNDIDTKIKDILDSGEETNILKMRKLLQKIDQLGGIESVLPTEGIVFKWNGKTYKLTGIFAPLNQMMGINRYS
jgi:cytidyltransferase-like protein